MVAVKFTAFPNPVGFCFVAIETRAGSLGEMCVHANAGGGVSWKLWHTRAGWGHGGRTAQKSLWRPCPLWGCSLQSAFDFEWCTLGEQASLCRSAGLPLALVQLFSRTSGKLWPLPEPKPLSPGDRDQWPLLGCFLTRVPDKCFSGNQWVTQIFDAKACVLLRWLSLLIKWWGQRRGLGREISENLAFQEIRTQAESLLPPRWFSGWESSKLSYYLMSMLLHAGADIRGGGGFEARD